MPRHPVAHRLIELAGVPVAAPSANSFGKTSPTRADFVLQDLDGRIDAVIDSGETALGLESTVVDACEEPPILYRPGMVTLQQLRSVVSRVGGLLRAVRGRLRAARLARLRTEALFSSRTAHSVMMMDNLLRLAAQLHGAGEKVGIMSPSAVATKLPYLIYEWGDLADQEELARRMFRGLRELDAAGATVIVCPLPEAEGLGIAIRDRLA